MATKQQYQSGAAKRKTKNKGLRVEPKESRIWLKAEIVWPPGTQEDKTLQESSRCLSVLPTAQLSLS